MDKEKENRRDTQNMYRDRGGIVRRRTSYRRKGERVRVSQCPLSLSLTFHLSLFYSDSFSAFSSSLFINQFLSISYSICLPFPPFFLCSSLHFCFPPLSHKHTCYSPFLLFTPSLISFSSFLSHFSMSTFFSNSLTL